MRAIAVALGLGLSLCSALLQAQPALKQEKCRLDYAAIAGSRLTPTGFKTSFPAAPGYPADNRGYLRIAEPILRGAPPPPNLFFLDVEIAVLKELNDNVVRDKDLVTAFTNLYKSIFLQELERDPVLRAALREPYSDFKSIRFIFEKTDPSLQERIRAVHLASGREFSRILQTSDVPQGWAEARGLSRNPANWFLAGVGGSPDEAGLAARSARFAGNQTGEQIGLRLFQDVTADLRERLVWAENARLSLARSLGNIPGIFDLDGGAPGRQVLSTEAISLLRRVKPPQPTLHSYIATVRRNFLDNFDYRLSDEQVLHLRDYVSLVDRFSPGLFLERREVIDLARAQAGIVSVDFAEQGSRNLQATMRALAGVTDPSEAALRARAQEQLATRDLNERKRSFAQTLARLGQQGPLQFSGDDGIFLPTRALSRSDRENLVTALAQRARPPASLRPTFLPQHYRNSEVIIPAAERSRLIGAAEDIEKELRRRLRPRLETEDYRGLIFAIDFEPAQGGGGTVNLMFAGTNPPNFTYILRNEFRSVLRDAGFTEGSLRRVHVPSTSPRRAVTALPTSS